MFRHPLETQYPEPTVWRPKHSLRSWQVHLNQVLKSLNLAQMKSDLCTFTGLDSSGHLGLIVMAYVDDLVIAGEAHAVQKFIQDIQETFSLKHVEYLTPDHPVEFLGRIIKVKESGQIMMEFRRKLIDNLLGLVGVTGPEEGQPQMESRCRRSRKKIKSNVRKARIQDSGKPLANSCRCHSSETTSRFPSESCQGH